MENQCFPFRPAAWLRVEGEDAAGYLQGQFSQDLRDAGRGTYALLLNHKGRIQADAFVVADPGGFWVGSYGTPAPRLADRLQQFIVADDVTVEDATAQWAGLSLLGPGAGPAAADLGAGGGGVVFPGRRCAGNWEVMLPADQAAGAMTTLAAAGWTQLTPEAMERLRIESGLPAVPGDAGPGEFPQEAGLEAAAVSFTKGCYVGQEVMARLKTRGRVRRQLRRVAGEGEPPAPGTKLWLGARPAGEMRTSARAGTGRFIGWALVAAEQPPVGSRLRAGSPEGAEIELTGS